MVIENYLYKSPTHKANLNEMRLSGKLCDVIVKVENKEFRAHKVILAANLKYFESMFLNSFRESKQEVIPMENVDGSDLEAFVNFAYTGEMLLTKSNALRLLEVADYLNEDAIKTACIDFLEVYLDANDAFRAYKFADAVECPALKNAARLRIQTNFGDCSQTIEYLDLDFESLKDVMNDVKFDIVELQQVLFEGIMRWLMHDPKERRTHVNELLRLIDVANLAADYLVNYLGSMADHSDDDYGIIKDVLSYYHRCSKIEHAKNLVKNAMQEADVLILLDNFDDNRFFHIYNFKEKKWSSLQEIPNGHGKIYCKSTILHDRIYYIGFGSTPNKLEIFNPKTRRTTILASSNILMGLAVCACNKFVFLCGGYEVDHYPSDQFLRYDPQTYRMDTLAPMGTKRIGAAAILYQGHLLILGGYDGNSYINSVEQYDFASQKWTVFPTMIMPRAWLAVAVLHGKLYACGGGSPAISSVEVYDPAQNSWHHVDNMNQMRRQFILVVREGKLWAIGGDEEKTVEVYDPNKDQWQMDHEMSSGLRMQNPSGGLISASVSVMQNDTPLLRS